MKQEILMLTNLNNLLILLQILPIEQRQHNSKKRSKIVDGLNDLMIEIHEYVGAYKHVATYF